MSTLTHTCETGARSAEEKVTRRFNKLQLVLLYIIWNYGFVLLVLGTVFGLSLYFWNDIIAFMVPEQYIPQSQQIPLGGKTFLILSGPSPAALRLVNGLRKMRRTQ